MRIISGSARGSQIFAPRGRDTRPTQDRVRESLFNILQGDVPGATVLDLFAGSGALALEAVSRGAHRAVAVDHAQDAVVCIQRNIAKLGFGDLMEVLSCDWRQGVQRLRGLEVQFDLVFLDPPYAMNTEGVCQSLADAGLLQEGALLVVEHRKGMRPALEEPFAWRRTRGYGDTEISLFDYTATHQEAWEES